MARYKPYDVHQDKFIPVSFRDQIQPGSSDFRSQTGYWLWRTQTGAGKHESLVRVG